MTLNFTDKWAPILVCVAWIWLSVQTTRCLRTITCGTAHHARRTVWLIKLFATIVASSNVFGVARLFGLHWSLSAALAALVVLFALTDTVTEIMPARSPQVSAAYAKSWREYSRLRKRTNYWVIMLLSIVLSGFVLTVALGIRLNERGFRILFCVVACGAGITFVGYAYSQWKLAYWPCPRCGFRYRSFWVASIMPKNCIHCGLARWAENPDHPLQTAGPDR